MTEVVEEFILKIILNDKTHGKEKMKKRAARLVEVQLPRPQIRNIDRENRCKQDHFRVMFPEKAK
jgi:hypothetical protein